jgi:hypothetical protein
MKMNMHFCPFQILKASAVQQCHIVEISRATFMNARQTEQEDPIIQLIKGMKISRHSTTDE